MDTEDRKRSEQARQEIEEQWKVAFESSPTMYFVIDEAGDIISANGYGAEQLGYTVSELVGQPVLNLFYEPDRPFIQERTNACFQQPGRVMRWEARKIRKDGTTVWVRETANAVILKSRPVLLVICEDINEQKRAEALLTGEKRILEMVAKGESLAQILDGLCRLVEEQSSGVLASVLLIEDNRLRHGGAPSLPKVYTDAIDGVPIGPCVGSCGTAAYTGKQVIVEDIATDPLWVDYRAAALPHSLRACWSTPIFSTQGKVIGTFAMYYRQPRRPSVRDQEIIEQITHLAGVAIERKLIEEALRRSEAYLAEAQRLAKTGSWAYNPLTGKSVYWSNEIFRIFGLDPREEPSSEKFWQLVHPEDRARVRERVERETHQKKEYSDEYRIVLPDGTIKHVLDIGHPVFDDAGAVVEFVGTTVDITESKRAEQERERLRQIEADLARVNRVSMMGEFTASLAHEIKQPITAVVNNAEACLQWLTRDPPDLVEMREAATEMVKDARRAAEIVTRTRSLFKKEEIKREVIDLNEVIRDTLFLIREEADRRLISVRTELDAGLPRVSGDRVQLQQVLINLLVNGLEAMNGNRGELTIRSQQDEDGRPLISVSDAGIGLPIGGDKIFDAFFTTKPQGTGMGLAISRSIVESHGGRLWATANSGPGAIFYFTLSNLELSSTNDTFEI